MNLKKRRKKVLPENEKQHTAEFESCIQRVMKQGHEKGSAFAICTDAFEKAGKPIYVGESETQKLHLFSESIKLEGRKVSGVCIHPKRIFHPEEDMTHVYLKEELEKAAPTLTGKPFGIDHLHILPPPNVITNSWYDSNENGVAYEGVVDDEIAQKIANKEFKGVSIELNWLRPGGKVEFLNGVAPRNFELTSVHLLRKFPPGDQDAYIRFWNAIMEQLVGVGPARAIDDRVSALESGLREMRTALEVINGKIDMLSKGLTSSQASSGGSEVSKNQVATVQSPEETAVKNKLTETECKLSEAGKKPQQASEHADIVTLRKDLVEAQAKLADTEKKVRHEKDRFVRFHEAVQGTLPDRATELRWLGTGPKLFTEKVKRVLHEFHPS
jgi:hypothetical protein